MNKDRSEEERPFWYKHKNDDALFMVTTSEKRRVRAGRTQKTGRDQDRIVGSRGDDAGGMQGGGGGV